MPISDSAHLMRDRAESFGAIAARYDLYRPGYPTELIDDLLALADGPVLDIGTGTGKAARLIADRGVDVLGVEVDAKMADVARKHGLNVEVASFENWPAAGRRFALIISAQAWHWVDPIPGAVKVAGLLHPGGTFAPFWNFEELDAAEQSAVLGAYQRLAPELVPAQSYGNKPYDRPYVADLTRSGAFADVSTRTYRWTASYPVEHWVERVGTHSDHLMLGPERLAAVQDGLRVALSAIGPEVHTTGGTYVVLARNR